MYIYVSYTWCVCRLVRRWVFACMIACVMEFYVCMYIVCVSVSV